MPWLDHYPDHIEWQTTFEPKSLTDLFDQAVADFGPHVCSNFKGATLTYAQIGRLVDRLAAGLQGQGIGRGHRVGLLLPNCPYYIIAYYAVLKLGAIVVNFNPLYSDEELELQARDSGISAMVTLDLKLLSDKAVALAERGLLEKLIICPFPAILPGLLSLLFKLLKGKELAKIKPGKIGSSMVIAYADLIGNDGTYQPVLVKPEEDIALFQYTGGTTGIPKAAMLSHANLSINLQQVMNWVPDSLMAKNPKIMAILPFFHVFANTSVMNFGILRGAEIIMMPKFDLSEAIKLIRKHKPNILPGVPTLYNALLNAPEVRKEDLQSLDFCVSGGAPLPLEIRRKFEALSGCKLVEGYGLSETSPVATTNPFFGAEKENSIGQPVQGTLISIRSLEDPGKRMPLGESGEICIKGPQVMQGYWNKPEANEAAFVEGYFRTGDVGYMDEFGFTYIIDRIKDLIICSGFNVYPRRIEEALYEHPAVEEVTVIGIPNEYRGEAPKAFIKLKQGQSADEAGLLNHLKPKLSKIEMPAEFEFRDELPKTMVGKLSKKELRE